MLTLSNLSSIIEKEEKYKVFWGAIAIIGAIYVGRRMYVYER
jgi:hypothetical protein